MDSDGQAGIEFSQAEKSALAAKSESEPASQTQTLVLRPHRRDVHEVVEGGRVVVDLADGSPDIMQPASRPKTPIRNVKKVVEGGRVVVEYADKTPDILPALKAVLHEQFQTAYRAEAEAQFDAVKTKMQTQINDVKIKMETDTNAMKNRINAMNDAMETKINAMKAEKDAAEIEQAASKAKIKEMEKKLTANGTDKEVPNVPAVIEDYRKRILVLEAYLRDRH